MSHTAEGSAGQNGILIDFGMARECRHFDETLEKTAATLQTTHVIGTHCKAPHALAEMYLNRAIDLLPEADPAKPFATTFESDNARALYDTVEAISRLDHLLNGAGGYLERFGENILTQGDARAEASETGKLVHFMPVQQRENFTLAASILDNLEDEVGDPSYLAGHYISRAISTLRHQDLNASAESLADAPRGARAVASAIEVIRTHIHAFQHHFGAGRVLQAFEQVEEDLAPVHAAQSTERVPLPA